MPREEGQLCARQARKESQVYKILWHTKVEPRYIDAFRHEILPRRLKGAVFFSEAAKPSRLLMRLQCSLNGR